VVPVKELERLAVLAQEATGLAQAQAWVPAEVPVREVEVLAVLAQEATGLAQAQAWVPAGVPVREVEVLALAEETGAQAQAEREAEAEAEEVSALATEAEVVATAEAEGLVAGSWPASPAPFARCQYRARRGHIPVWRGRTSAGC